MARTWLSKLGRQGLTSEPQVSFFPFSVLLKKQKTPESCLHRPASSLEEGAWNLGLPSGHSSVLLQSPRGCHPAAWSTQG